MNMTVSGQAAAPPRRFRRVPWSPHPWRRALYLAGGIPALLVITAILVALALVSQAHTVGVHRMTAFAWLAGVAAIFLLVPVLNRVHRHRLRSAAGLDIPPQPKRADWFTGPGLVALVRSRSLWRQLGYHVFVSPFLAVAAAATTVLWLMSSGLALVYGWAWGLGRDETFYKITYGYSGTHHPIGGILLTAAGVAGLCLAPWVTAGVAWADEEVTQALLGPSRADELAHRVEQLTETRAGVVDAADAERRRLERDLHDGTQQRLVSLAINLGLAQAHVTTVAEAQTAIAEAHEETKAALAELRDLIRGLHPAVLEDRGLDAALSGIAARMPIPVRLTVDLPRRPAPVIEAVAYFVVSEGLANIVKHAQASEAAVFVQRSGDRLHVIVTDDGVGGADPAGGTGLAGLARRAASVDGTFEIDSPPGGPTLLTVDLPCNR